MFLSENKLSEIKRLDSFRALPLHSPAAGKVIGEKIGKVKIPLYFYARKDGRVVDCGGLENR